MSKFVDKLQDISKSSRARMGFHPSVSEPRSPAILLIAGLSPAQVKEARTLADVKADAGLVLSEGASGKVLKQMVEAADSVPVGVFVKGMTEERISELASAGCDFVVFDIRIPATVLHREGVGKFLMMEPSLDQGLVRAVNSLEIDGVFVSNRDGDSSVTVEQLLTCRRCVELLEKPVMAILPSSVTKAVLIDLWQVGVDGVVAPSGQSVEALAELRKMTGDLPRGARGRRPKAGVVLPHYGGNITEEEDEEEEGT